MRWDALVKAFAAAAVSSPPLHAIFGEAVRVHGTAKHQVPLLELRLVADSEDELWEPATIQWDIWTKSLEDQREAERALRRLFHAEAFVTVAGIDMWSQYVDGDTTATPDRDGFFGRAIRFRHTPLREHYVARGS